MDAWFENATPVLRTDVMTGVPESGEWEAILGSDNEAYGGSGFEYPPSYTSTAFHHNGYEQSLWLTLPPLSIVFLHLKR